uniref:DH domain-containing protein n=1 Tax=Stegastes partitus TaxID=144197 RepID=A0A3B5B6M7_9TELE
WRESLLFEVVTSEASYCRSLDIVVEHFVKSKQLGAKLTTQDRNWLFSRLFNVLILSCSFLSKLEERVESDIMSFTVCDIIARHCQRFRMVYVPYLTNQSYQDATYQRLMNENQDFKQIVAKLERSPVCQRLPLRSFLVLPFQRITRIKLLVQVSTTPLRQHREEDDSRHGRGPAGHQGSEAPGEGNDGRNSFWLCIHAGEKHLKNRSQ